MNDDATKRFMPDDDTDSPNESKQPDLNDFTQVTSQPDKTPKYAIPDADPMDLTVENAAIEYHRDDDSSYTQQARTQVSSSIRYSSPQQTPIPVPYVPPPPPPPIRQQQPAQRPVRQNWLWVFAAMLLLGGTLALSGAAFIVIRLASAASTSAVDPTAEPSLAAAISPTIVPTATVGLQIQPWDGNRRVTILLMGLDKRPSESGTAFRTDSMMIVSIDPVTKSVGILSVPRDLFVEIPSDTVVRNAYGLQRVNAAYVIGELARPGYGPQLAMQTVQYNLGIRINDYVVYEFNTVIAGIDAVGGIDVDVPYTINDPAYPDMYFGYDPLYIPAGHQHLNGTMALKYARTRHQTSDFDRAKRQQQVVMAVRDQVLKGNNWLDLARRAPEIWDQLSRTTRSDLSFDQMLRLALYLKDIPKENIRQGVIDASYVTSVTYQGQAILVPERVRLGPLLQQIFGTNYNS